MFRPICRRTRVVGNFPDGRSALMLVPSGCVISQERMGHATVLVLGALRKGTTFATKRHPSLKPGDPCPTCATGTVYETGRPGVVLRLVGQPPVGAKVYSLQKLRCNLCGDLFTAPLPDGVGRERVFLVPMGCPPQVRAGPPPDRRGNDAMVCVQ
jgi:hypothetical protein